MSEYKSDIMDIKESLMRSNARMDDIELRVEAMNLSLTDNLNLSTNTFESNFARLRHEMQEREQEMLVNDVEIAGIPEDVGEALNLTIIRVASQLGVPLDEFDIVSAMRVGPQLIFVNGKPLPPRSRPIIVRLARRSTRNALLYAARDSRSSEAAANIGHFENFHIYERLTLHNRQLLRRTREMASLAQWRFVWSRDGKIYTRKQQGSKRYRVHSVLDFDRVFGRDINGPINIP